MDTYLASGWSDYFHPHIMSHINKEEVGTIFEVGAAEGKDTLLLNSYFNARVFAFECDPRMLALCRKNIAGKSGVFLTEKAAWHENTILKFYPVVENIYKGQNRDTSGRSSLFKARPDYLESYIQSEIYVEAIRLADFCQAHNIQAIDLLCMDVQGAGKQVLQGLANYLKTVRYLIIEIEHKEIYFGQSLFSEIDPFLLDNGFIRKAEVVRDAWFSDFLYCRA